MQICSNHIFFLNKTIHISQFFFWDFFKFVQKLKISLAFGPVIWLVHTCSSQFSINCEVKLISSLTWNNSSHKVWNHFFPVVAVFQRAPLEFVPLCNELQIKTEYRISANSFRGNYSREQTIQGWKLFAEIRYLVQHRQVWPMGLMPAEQVCWSLHNNVIIHIANSRTALWKTVPVVILWYKFLVIPFNSGF